jgi:hypothetical protein
LSAEILITRLILDNNGHKVLKEPGAIDDNAAMESPLLLDLENVDIVSKPERASSCF